MVSFNKKSRVTLFDAMSEEDANANFPILPGPIPAIQPVPSETQETDEIQTLPNHTPNPNPTARRATHRVDESHG